MIHQTPIFSRLSNDSSCSDSDPDSWQKALKSAFRNPVDLLEYLKLPQEFIARTNLTKIPFPMVVPLSFAQRMTTGDINDPLLLQVLPQAKELEIHPDYSADPVGDLQSMVLPGLLHKYHARVLLTLTGACAVHCRYCFRRHFPYSDATVSTFDWQQIINYLQNNITINEVILSGGDPLSLSNRRFQEVINHLESIEHVKYLRVHTRLPIVLPERINRTLVNMLKASRLKVIFVIHCNHANEINHEVKHHLQKLSEINVRLLNQSVLLHKINDNLEALCNLSRKLFDLDVMPYYLHVLDKVSGAQHFDLARSDAKKLYTQLQNNLPGYLVPKLVEEISGEPSKMPLN